MKTLAEYQEATGKAILKKRNISKSKSFSLAERDKLASGLVANTLRRASPVSDTNVCASNPRIHCDRPRIAV